MTHFGLRTALLGVSFLAGTPLGALAAAAPPQTSSAAALDEVIVTARKREERLQDVPLSVTAVTGTALERQNIVRMTDLASQSPSLTIGPGLGSSRAIPTFSIRGMSQQEQTLLADPSVTVYVGDIVAARQQGLNQDLLDIGSVEVLKGPQGTLFGRNSTGGAVVIKPNKPTGLFEGDVGATVGSFGKRNFEGMVNLPLGDKAALRVAAGSNQDDGWLTDVILHRKVNYTDTKSLRVSLDLKPTERLDSLFVFNGFDENDGQQGNQIAYVNPNSQLAVLLAIPAFNYQSLQTSLTNQHALGYRQFASGVPQFTKVGTWDVANTSSWRVSDGITAKNILGVRQVRSHILVDTDGTPAAILATEKNDHVSQFSDEFQILGDSGSRNWIVGAYYFREQGRDHGLSAPLAQDPGAIEPASMLAYQPFPPFSAGWNDSEIAATNISYAVFAQGTQKLDSLLKGLSLTGGIRGNWDERNDEIKTHNANTCGFTVDADHNPATPEVLPSLANCSLPLNHEFSEPTWTVGLDWKADRDTLVYLSSRHGYRTGGFINRATTQASLEKFFKPERVTDVEAGLKRDWRVDGVLLRTNLAAYVSDFRDIQRSLTDPTAVPIATVTVNAKRALVRGLEAEFMLRPTSHFELSGFYSLTDAKYTDFVEPDGTVHTGQALARTPRNIYSVTARVILPLDEAAGEVSGSLNYYYTDGYISDDTAPSASDPVLGQFAQSYWIRGYGLWNANVEWAGVMGTRVDLSVFATNLGDKQYNLPGLNLIQSFGYASTTPGAPRMFGIRMKYHF